MAIGEELEVSEAQIAVHWREEEYIQPPPRFVGQANAHDPAILDRFREENFPECFREYADLLSWDRYWHTTLDSSDPPFWKPAQRLLQLRRPASRDAGQSGGTDLGARARG
jgi:acetyl-CoA synthetase